MVTSNNGNPSYGSVLPTRRISSDLFAESSQSSSLTFGQRWLMRSGAAAAGNCASSALSVLKEQLLKQQLQYNEGGETFLHIALRTYRRQGLRVLQWQMFAAGPGALVSGLMTPLDVLKMRLSTGTWEVTNAATEGAVPANCAQTVVTESGWTALLGRRLQSCSVPSALALATLELAKRWFGVVEDDDDDDDDDDERHNHQRSDRKDDNHKNSRQQ